MTYQKILCPTDFSVASYEALRKAVELALGNGAEICLVHVEQPITLPTNASITDFTQSEAERRAEAVSNLCAVVNERVAPSVRARPLLKSGEAAKEIVNAAREEGADLIVLTTHGAGGAPADTLGRVAEDVIRTAPCPVLAIKVASHMGASDTGKTIDGDACLSYESLPAALETVSSKAIFLDGD